MNLLWIFYYELVLMIFRLWINYKTFLKIFKTKIFYQIFKTATEHRDEYTPDFRKVYEKCYARSVFFFFFCISKRKFIENNAEFGVSLTPAVYTASAMHADFIFASERPAYPGSVIINLNIHKITVQNISNHYAKTRF